MKQFNPHVFYAWGQSIKACTGLGSDSDTPLKDVLWPLYSAKDTAAAIIRQDILPLPLTKAAALELWNAIKTVVPDDLSGIANDKLVRFWELYSIKSSANKFETILAAELQGANTYSVLQKGIYSTSDLIDRAANALGIATMSVIEQTAQADFGAAGRCLAFELPTACGFHVMRATESVLRQYHRLLMDLPPSKKSPEMATCIDQLRKAGEDNKVMESLDHIRGMHRNPLMHPEDFLTMDEALQLFDIGKSAITSMSGRIIAINKDPTLITTAQSIYAGAPKKKKP
ncbi:MAG: hypothetical protein ABL967_18120 [Bryobacteraceae bacterium]